MKQGKPKRRFMDEVKEDIAEVEVMKGEYRRKAKLEMDNPLWRPLMEKAERTTRLVYPNIPLDFSLHVRTILIYFSGLFWIFLLLSLPLYCSIPHYAHRCDCTHPSQQLYFRRVQLTHVTIYIKYRCAKCGIIMNN